MSLKLTNILVRESDRLARLVDDFLRFARVLRSRCAEKIHLDALLTETVDMLRAVAGQGRAGGGVRLQERLMAAVDPDQRARCSHQPGAQWLQAAGPQG